MILSEYYDDIHAKVERFLSEKGFHRERHEKLQKIGDVWSGNLEVCNEPLGIYLVIPMYFPDKLPRVYLRKRPSFPLPHVDPNLFVCTERESGLVYRQENFLVLIQEILGKATNIISDGISGNNHGDFDREFLDYWGIESDERLISILNPYDDIVRVVVVSVAFGDKKFRAVGKSVETVEKYFKKIDPKYKVSYRCIGWFTKLAHIPRPPFPKSITDAEKDLLLQSKSHIKKYKKTIPKELKAVPYVVFSVPGEIPVMACWGANYKDRQHQLRRNIIERWDADRIQMRIGNRENILKEIKVCIIGCGSIGSRVAMGLVEAGAKTLLLIDPEKLDIGNIARHLCGANYVDNYKVEAVKRHIEQHFPYSEIATIAGDILEVFEKRINEVVSCDLVISAVGELNINRRLNILACSREGFPPVIFSFIEAYGIASHSLLVNAQSGGCFECSLDNDLKFKYCVAAFGDKQPETQEAGCQTTFLPYSSEDTKMAASIVIRQTIEALSTEYLKSQHKVWVADLEEMSRCGIKRTPIYADARSFTIYTYNHGRKRGCNVCKDR